MKISLLSNKTTLIVIIGWFLLYYVAGEISEILTPENSDISVVWFPAGIATTAFLCMRKRQWLPLLIGFIVLNLILNGFDSEKIILSLIYAILAILSCIIIAWIVRRYAQRGDDLHLILLWLSTTIIVSFADAVLFSFSMYWLDNISLKDIFWDGFIADITGNIFATTVIMGLINTRFKKVEPFFKINIILGSVVFILLITSTILIFNDTAIQIYHSYFHQQRNIAKLSLLCIPILLAVILSMLWGNRGGSIALLILATITIYYTRSQQGPFYLHGLFRHESLWLIQGYLTVISLLMVFLRVVARSTHRIDDTQGAYKQQHLVYQLNLDNGVIEWGNIDYSFPKADLITLSNIKQIMESTHPDDREKLAKHWRQGQAHTSLPIITFCLKDKEGRWWNIEDRGSVIFRNNKPVMIVGNWFILDEVS
ncbi:MASE1 domain-containing protein [Moellerella wisconsensis]|uniref:Putative transmembrane protein n=1 Tax=Moellerella wisconsensis ATCC 35017 TaxID=1354267 RepID=A0A0N1KHP6_9GAMM|nr:MASE1 domain-containing protein [Moellerella wisconsensis]KPD03139.1 putative transmembrane protein [Moellerella wisconsensis ATCC 35017]VFS48733.1 Predicted integral membrane sensor domain [Moellerella wisconsensis]